jgi:Cu+-exporting ATPase
VGTKSLFRLAPNKDSLIAIGTAAAFLYSVYSTARIIGAANTMPRTNCILRRRVLSHAYFARKTARIDFKGKTNEALKKLMSLAAKDRGRRPRRTEEILLSMRLSPATRLSCAPEKDSGRRNGDGRSYLRGRIDAHRREYAVDKTAGDPVYAASLNSNGSN